MRSTVAVAALLTSLAIPPASALAISGPGADGLASQAQYIAPSSGGQQPTTLLPVGGSAPSTSTQEPEPAATPGSGVKGESASGGDADPGAPASNDGTAADPASGEGGDGVAPQFAAAQASPMQLQSAAGSSTAPAPTALAFTGYPAMLVVVIGLLLIVGGLAGTRMAARRGA